MVDSIVRSIRVTGPRCSRSFWMINIVHQLIDLVKIFHLILAIQIISLQLIYLHLVSYQLILQGWIQRWTIIARHHTLTRTSEVVPATIRVLMSHPSALQSLEVTHNSLSLVLQFSSLLLQLDHVISSLFSQLHLSLLDLIHCENIV